MREVNAQYSVVAPESFAARTAARMRRVMYERFLALAAVGADDSILDVGATSDRSYESSNYVEAWYPHKSRIVAAGIDDASFLPSAYPGLEFVRADGLALPFSDGAFDVVHSSAVIEHVGSAERQARFVAELARVARRCVFVTTPNRWFPVEFHSVLPLVHWLPKRWFRAILAHIGHARLAEEANLNLMDAGALLATAPPGFKARCLGVRLWGWKSNLLLVLERE